MHHGDVHFDHRSPPPQMTGSRQRPKSPEPSQNRTETNDPNISPNDSMIPNVQFASICHMSAISAITMKLSPPTRHPHGPARLRSKSRRPNRAMAPHPNVPDCEAPAANPMPFLPPTGDGSKNTLVILGTVYGIGFIYWFTTLQAIPFIIGLHED